jgi:hypothetical protein
MAIRNVIRANPSFMSAIGALMVFLAWFLNATVVDRVSEITRQIENLDQQQFVTESLSSLNRKLNNLAIELSDAGDPHAETALDSQVNRISARLKERIALDESYQDIQRYAGNLVAAVDNAPIKPAGLISRAAQTHNKIRDAVQRSAEANPRFRAGTEDFKTEIAYPKVPKSQQKYIAENDLYLAKADAAAGNDLMAGLSNELSSEEGELVGSMRSQREAREREAKLGNIASGLLFALGTGLTIYCQWLKDSSDATSNPTKS